MPEPTVIVVVLLWGCAVMFSRHLGRPWGADRPRTHPWDREPLVGARAVSKSMLVPRWAVSRLGSSGPPACEPL